MLRLFRSATYDLAPRVRATVRDGEVKVKSTTVRSPATGHTADAGSQPVLVLLAVVVLFGMTWPVIKLGLDGGATPLWFAVGRAGFSTLASFLMLLALGRLSLPPRAD